MNRFEMGLIKFRWAAGLTINQLSSLAHIPVGMIRMAESDFLDIPVLEVTSDFDTLGVAAGEALCQVVCGDDFAEDKDSKAEVAACRWAYVEAISRRSAVLWRHRVMANAMVKTVCKKIDLVAEQRSLLAAARMALQKFESSIFRLEDVSGRRHG